MLERIIENWYMFLILLLVLAVVIGGMINRFRNPGSNETMFGNHLRQARKDINSIRDKK